MVVRLVKMKMSFSCVDMCITFLSEGTQLTSETARTQASCAGETRKLENPRI